MNKTNEVLIALRKVIRATDIHSKHLVKTYGLTAPQILLMQIINDKKRVMVSELAKQMSLSQSTVTNIVDRLEKKAWLMRQRSEQDKRIVYVSLSEVGVSIVNGAPTPLQHDFQARFEGLDEWEQSMIIASLQRVAKMMDAEAIDASPVLHIGAIEQASKEN